MTGIQYANLTQEHIDDGEIQDSLYCALTLCLNDIGLCDVETYDNRVYILGATPYEPGPLLQRWLFDFDYNGKDSVCPIKIKIDHDALTIEIVEED